MSRGERSRAATFQLTVWIAGRDSTPLPLVYSAGALGSSTQTLPTRPLDLGTSPVGDRRLSGQDYWTVVWTGETPDHRRRMGYIPGLWKMVRLGSVLRVPPGRMRRKPRPPSLLALVA